MIFVGDIALPRENSIKYKLPSFFEDTTIIANLEGALVKDSEKYLNTSKIVNELKPIEKLSKKYKIHFSINNNHILDNNNFNESRGNFEKLNLSVFGAGENIDVASKPLVLKDENKIILNFGWEIVECKLATKKDAGVNPLIRKYILNEFVKYQSLYPGFKIFVLFHWDYELEAFPMPSQRALSFELIDLGCDLIVGAHPHRVQGYEYYKNKPIVYSLGNFLFRQNVFRSGTLKYPSFCDLELAFEYSDDGNHNCHFFVYDKEKHILSYLKSESLNRSEIMKKLSPFNKVSINEYDKWFSKNRYHKKIIPIYKVNEKIIIIKLKDVFNKFRTSVVNLISLIKIFLFSR